MTKKPLGIVQLQIDKLVHGGQGLGVLEDGRKCFVWGALPGEEVLAQLIRRKKDWAEAVVTEILTPSPDRVDPLEPDIYLATSPWQILDYAKEAEYKQAILAETFEREGLNIEWQAFTQGEEGFGYRNKMEYNFWYFNGISKVSLALHRRGSHQKVAVSGSALASDAINNAGQALVDYINSNNIEARPLKSVILRSDASGMVGVSLFVNEKEISDKFSKFQLTNTIFEIIYSNPKSPASVVTEILKPDDRQLTDSLLGRKFSYSTRSFFQVNIPIYEQVLEIIAKQIASQPQVHVLDIYSGVGSIGLSVIGQNQKLTMVETSQECTDQARLNTAGLKNCEVVTATAETALDYITGNEIVILDPPRAGLHSSVTERLVSTKPAKIIYLSCNPSTQARDAKLLVDAGYNVTYAAGFNFFTRTPHIESLLALER